MTHRQADESSMLPLMDEALPLLHGIAASLHALSLASTQTPLSCDDVSTIAALLAERVMHVEGILEQWTQQSAGD